MPRPIAAALLLPVLLVLGSARSDAGDDARLDLTGARVLVSPGLPEALRPFLPEGSAPEPLRWPLPDGPLLLLGLPETDRAALEIGETLGVLDPAEDLAGGYVVSAWHDGKRPVAVVLASDAAALFAARFEIEPVLPEASRDRTADVVGGSGGACTCVARGRRAIRPKYRERALWLWETEVLGGTSAGGRPAAQATLDPVLRAVAAHANWIWLRVKDDEGAARSLAERARRFGIRVAPAFVVPVDAPESIVELGVEQAKTLGSPAVAVLAVGTTPELAAALDGLAAAGLEAHLVVGFFDADLGPRVGTRFELLENPADPRMPPSMPRRPKPPDVDGAVVPDIVPLAEVMLARAFDASAPAPPEPADVLLPFVPADARDPRDLLERTGAALAAAPPETVRESPWVRAYAEGLKGRARRWSPGACEAIVPVVRDAPATDGSLDDRAWAHAAVRRAAGVEVLLVSDGRDLHVGVRFPASLASSVGLELESDSGKAAPIRDGRTSDAEGTVVRSRDAAGTRTVEARLDGDTFGGDVCPGRVLRLRVRTAASPGAAVECALVVGR